MQARIAFVDDKVTGTSALAIGSQHFVIRPWSAVNFEISAGGKPAATSFRAVTLIVLVEDVSVVHIPAPVAITIFNSID